MKTKFEDGQEIEEIMIMGGSSSKMIHHTKIVTNVYKVYLDEDIGEPSKYRDLITLLSDANEGDEIHLLINSCGGRGDSALALIELIQNSEADVSAILLGDCHSAASLIAMSCKTVGVTNAASMLVHTGSYGSVGNNHNIRRQVEFTNKQINSMLERIYKGFLSDKELEEVKSGIEFWFDAKDIQKRLKQRNKYLLEKAKIQKEETSDE
jgi:ATP-dependent Clp protease, protease subunit